MNSIALFRIFVPFLYAIVTVYCLECYDSGISAYKECVGECAVVSEPVSVQPYIQGSVNQMCSEEAPFTPQLANDCILGSYIKNGTQFIMVCTCDTAKCNEETTGKTMSGKNSSDYLDQTIKESRSCWYKSPQPDASGHMQYIAATFACPKGMKYCLDVRGTFYTVNTLENDATTSLLYTSAGADDSQMLSQSYCLPGPFKYKNIDYTTYGCMNTLVDLVSGHIERVCACHNDNCNYIEDVEQNFKTIPMSGGHAEGVTACLSSNGSVVEVCVETATIKTPVCMRAKLSKGLNNPIEVGGCLTDEMVTKFSLDAERIAMDRSCFGASDMQHAVCLCQSQLCNSNFNYMVAMSSRNSIKLRDRFALSVSIQPNQQVVHPLPTNTFTIVCGDQPPRAIDEQRRSVTQICKQQGRNAIWQPQFMQCKKECAKTLQLENATVTYPTYPVEGSSANITCEGILKTGPLNQDTTTTVQCISISSSEVAWASMKTPVCQNMCSPIMGITTVTYSDTNGAYKSNNSTATVECQYGFVIEGTNTDQFLLHCFEGIWLPAAIPNCVAANLYSMLEREPELVSEYNMQSGTPRANEDDFEEQLNQTRNVNLKHIRAEVIHSYLHPINKDKTLSIEGHTSLSELQLAVCVCVGMLVFGLLMVFMAYEVQKAMMGTFYRIQRRTKIE